MSDYDEVETEEAKVYAHLSEPVSGHQHYQEGGYWARSGMAIEADLGAMRAADDASAEQDEPVRDAEERDREEADGEKHARLCYLRAQTHFLGSIAASLGYLSSSDMGGEHLQEWSAVLGLNLKGDDR